MVENLKRQLASQGISYEQYVQFAGGDESKILADAQEPALRQIRMDLAVEAIIKAEGIDATDEEIEAEMKKVADNYGMDVENVKKYLRTEDVKEQVVREKVIKLVADNAVAVAPVEEKKEEKKEEKTEE